MEIYKHINLFNYSIIKLLNYSIIQLLNYFLRFDLKKSLINLTFSAS